MILMLLFTEPSHLRSLHLAVIPEVGDDTDRIHMAATQIPLTHPG